MTLARLLPLTYFLFFFMNFCDWDNLLKTLSLGHSAVQLGRGGGWRGHSQLPWEMDWVGE